MKIELLEALIAEDAELAKDFLGREVEGIWKLLNPLS